jgi:hypothetical protein
VANLIDRAVIDGMKDYITSVFVGMILEKDFNLFFVPIMINQHAL